MNFTTIEHREDADRNWRGAYQQMIVDIRQTLLVDRARGFTKPEYFDWKRWVPAEMTDAQIEYLARRKAERAIERAINERKALETKSRNRAGLAA